MAKEENIHPDVKDHSLTYHPAARMAKEDNIDLLVLYCSDQNIKGHLDKGFGVNVQWDIPLLEGYNYKFLKNNSWKPSIFTGFFGLLNFSIFRELKKEKGSFLVIHGWAHATNILAVIAAKLYGLKLCLRSENPLNQELLKSPLSLFFRRLFFKYFFFRLFDYFFYIGEQNKKLYVYYGVKDEKLVFTPYAVDNERLQGEYVKYKDIKMQLRQELGFPQNKIIILTSGKYIEKKQPLDLLKAYRLLDDDNAVLVFLGEGELRKEMENYIRENNLNNVFLTGFKNQTEVGKYFAAADIFVLTSGVGETWGLVVNEAMNFALPVVVNELVGCAKDLACYDNGFVFSTHNDLAEILKKLMGNPAMIKRMGNASLEKIKDYSYNKTIENLLKIK